MTENNFYCVILAGGKGKRLWPFSRDSRPKQFVDLFGFGRTSLQQTFDRFAKFLPQENIIISTLQDYLPLVKEQLPEVAEQNILCEPILRGTAPALALAANKIYKRNRDAAIIASPTDLMILDDEAFRENVLNAFGFVSTHDKLLTMGVRPTRPERGYGYIQVDGEAIEEDIYKVKSFTEKPDLEFAKMFMDSGEFYWNTGMVAGSVVRMLEEIRAFLPSLVFEDYTQYPNASIDTAVLEKSDNVCVMTCRFGWADLGTWHNIFEQMPKNVDNNVMLASRVIIEDSNGNLIKTNRDKLTVIKGLKDFIVVDDGNVLLICKRGNSSAAIRKYQNEAQIKMGDEYR